MNRSLSRILATWALVLFLGACGTPDETPDPAPAPAPGATSVASSLDGLHRLPADAASVSSEIEALDLMRSSLAGPLSARTETVNDTTFAQVCKPVGMKARSLSESYGWTVRQVATRFRNPANAADSTLAGLFSAFESDSALVSVWHRSPDGTGPGWRYSRRITVEQSCLACHGTQDERPAFIQSGYPDDRAFGFEPGDLRGLYVVFVPDER